MPNIQKSNSGLFIDLAIRALNPLRLNDKI